MRPQTCHISSQDGQRGEEEANGGGGRAENDPKKGKRGTRYAIRYITS